MREISEQESLARLIGQEDMEPVDTAGLLESGLRASLGGVSQEMVEKVKREITASGDIVENRRIVSASASSSSRKLPEGYSTEEVLVSMYDIRDDLVALFEATGINTRYASRITGAIAKAEKCIRTAGGDVEKFIPMDHVSGLAAPDLKENAQKVIETTLRCYSLGKVESGKIKNGGKTISIIFSGHNGNVPYIAEGEATSDDWTGNEAIDYIYTADGGNMTIKAYENGRWIVKNTQGNDKYKVVWGLEFPDAKSAKVDNEELTKESETVEGNNNSEEILVAKKEEKQIERNNDEEEIKDPI